MQADRVNMVFNLLAVRVRQLVNRRIPIRIVRF